MQQARRRVRAGCTLIALSVAAVLGTAVVAPTAPALAGSQAVTVNFASTAGMNDA